MLQAWILAWEIFWTNCDSLHQSMDQKYYFVANVTGSKPPSIDTKSTMQHKTKLNSWQIPTNDEKEDCLLSNSLAKINNIHFQQIV